MDGAKKPRIVNASQVGSETPKDGDIPAAGFQRDEEFKRREDWLQKEAEQMANELGLVGFDASSVKLDSEVVQELLKSDVVDHSKRPSPSDVSQADSSYTYCWVPVYQNGWYIKAKQFEKWEIVQNNMKEAKEYKQADNTRRCVDCLLMRIRTDRYIVLKLAERAFQEGRVEAAVSSFAAKGEQYRSRGIITHYNPVDDDFFSKKFPAYAAKQQATEKLNQYIRAGTVPGAEMRR
jgi:hypothetical protein